MKKLILSVFLLCVAGSAMACDYTYTADNGDEVCANSGDKEVTITTDSGAEHSGEWVGNGVIQDNDNGDTLTIDQ